VRQGDASAAAALMSRRDATTPLVREHIDWALAQAPTAAPT